MPELVKMLLRHAAIGFAIAALFVGLLLATDMGGVRTLVMESDVGLLAVFMLTFFLGLTFGSAQMGFAVMLSGRDRNDRSGGIRFRVVRTPQNTPAYVTVRGRRR